MAEWGDDLALISFAFVGGPFDGQSYACSPQALLTYYGNSEETVRAMYAAAFVWCDWVEEVGRYRIYLRGMGLGVTLVRWIVPATWPPREPQPVHPDLTPGPGPVVDFKGGGPLDGASITLDRVRFLERCAYNTAAQQLLRVARAVFFYSHKDRRYYWPQMGEALAIYWDPATPLGDVQYLPKT